MYGNKEGRLLMETALRQLYQDRASEENTYAILVLEKEHLPLSMTDGFDAIILLITHNPDVDWYVKHYNVNKNRIAFHTLSQDVMHHSLIAGNQRRLVHWLVRGKIVFDRNEFLQGVKERIETFPPGDRSKKMTIQFAKMLRRFEEGKILFQQCHFFDAYSNLLHALHHLARLAVIYHGYYPETTVWQQMKKIEPETYKLYEELLKSEEGLEKRIELLILTMELAIHSKTEVGSDHFLSLLRLRQANWSISEIMELQEIENYKVDVELLLSFLIDKQIIIEEYRHSKAPGIEHLRYRVSTSL